MIINRVHKNNKTDLKIHSLNLDMNQTKGYRMINNLISLLRKEKIETKFVNWIDYLKDN